jgi:Protein of unknown function (DUF2281)
MQEETSVAKIKKLPPERIAEVEDFVDFLSQRAGQTSQAARREAITAYAAHNAGTDADLDVELERATLAHLHDERGVERRDAAKFTGPSLRRAPALSGRVGGR